MINNIARKAKLQGIPNVSLSQKSERWMKPSNMKERLGSVRTRIIENKGSYVKSFKRIQHVLQKGSFRMYFQSINVRIMDFL